VDLCYNSVQLYGINPKGPIGGKSTSEAAVGQALCVEKYNTAIRVSKISSTLQCSCRHDSFMISHHVAIGRVLHRCHRRVVLCFRHRCRHQAALLYRAVVLIGK